MRNTKGYVFAAVTADEFELPIYVCDTADELAEKLGIHKNTVFSLITHNRNGHKTGRKVIKIKI